MPRHRKRKPPPWRPLREEMGCDAPGTWLVARNILTDGPGERRRMVAEQFGLTKFCPDERCRQRERCCGRILPCAYRFPDLVGRGQKAFLR